MAIRMTTAGEVDAEAIALEAGKGNRTISPLEAKEMMEHTGVWFEVEVGATTKNNMRMFCSRMKTCMPDWYGGSWEVLADNNRKKVFVRFVGRNEERAAA